MDSVELAGLLQLSSAALPIGSFSYSSGLEAAHAAGLLADAAGAQAWIGAQLEQVWARGEAPLWAAAYRAWAQAELPTLRECNDRLLASRETSELLLECTQTGHSLRRWLLALPDLQCLGDTQRQTLIALEPAAYGTVHALAARALGLSEAAGLQACGWSLLENLGTAAVKLIPLGQTQGQALLRTLALRLPAAVARAQASDPALACNYAPMLAILSAQHETQYSRLFRS